MGNPHLIRRLLRLSYAHWTLTWYQSHFLVAFTRQNPAFLHCYGFTVSSPRSQTLSPFLPFSESSSPSFCLTQNHLHWIDLIKICQLPSKSARSSPARAAKSFWLSSHARTRSHAQTSFLSCLVPKHDCISQRAPTLALCYW